MFFGRFFEKIKNVKKCACGCSPSHFFEPNSVLSKTRFLNLSRGTLYMALGSRMGSSRERFKSRVCDKTEFGSKKWLGLQSQTHFLTISNISENVQKTDLETDPDGPPTDLQRTLPWTRIRESLDFRIPGRALKIKFANKNEFGSKKWLGLQPQTLFSTISKLFEKCQKDHPGNHPHGFFLRTPPSDSGPWIPGLLCES